MFAAHSFRRTSVVAAAVALSSCSRTITKPIPDGPALAVGRLTIGSADAAAVDSTRARVVNRYGPLPNAQLFVAFDTNSSRPLANGARFSVPPHATTVRLHVRALGYGQFDTTLVADQVRGHELEVMLHGVIATPPLVLVEKVPWWKFWVW